jgi:hypothetical protein
VQLYHQSRKGLHDAALHEAPGTNLPEQQKVTVPMYVNVHPIKHKVCIFYEGTLSVPTQGVVQIPTYEGESNENRKNFF